MLLGLAVPGDTDSIPAGGLVRLSDATYRDRRAGHDGVGRAAASALLKVAEHVGPEVMVSIFPELAAATAAIGRLRDGELPEGLAEFDRVVVDEVQDLTAGGRRGRQVVPGERAPTGTCALVAGDRRRRPDRTPVGVAFERPADRAPRRAGSTSNSHDRRAAHPDVMKRDRLSSTEAAGVSLPTCVSCHHQGAEAG